MRILINSDELEVSGLNKIIYQGPTIEERGRSGKTYTIQIAKTPKNINLLGDIWAVHWNNRITYNVILDTGTILIDSVLLIIGATNTVADAILLFGVGNLTTRLQSLSVKDIDFSDFDHIYDFGETFLNGYYPFIYDCGTRGARRYADSYTLEELYPAFQVKSLVRAMLGDVMMDIEDIDDSYYLLMTQDYNIRNSADWAKKAIYKRSKSSEMYQYNGYGSGNMVWMSPLELDNERDNGNNWVDGLGYIVKETGTYMFTASFEKISAVFQDNTGEPVTLTYNGVPNRVFFEFIIFRNDLHLAWKNDILTVDGNGEAVYGKTEITTNFFEFNEGDVISYGIRWVATVSMQPGRTTAFYSVVSKPEHYSETSRYYGHTSMVRAADLLPNVRCIDLLGAICKALNLSVYVDNITQHVYIKKTGLRGSNISLELNQIEHTISPRRTFELQFLKDGATKDSDVIVFDISDYGERYMYDMQVARVATGWAYGLTGVPLLDSKADDWETKLELRIVQLVGFNTDEVFYVRRYGGGLMSQYRIHPIWAEPDWVTLHDVNKFRGVHKLTGLGEWNNKLLTAEGYIRPVSIEGVGNGYIIEAEQQKDNIYRYNIEL